MSRVEPPADKRTNFRIEAVLEAPTWMLVAAVFLITVAVLATTINQF